MYRVAMLAAHRRLLLGGGGRLRTALALVLFEDTQLFHHFLELPMYLAPLTDPQEGEEVLFARAPQLGSALALLLAHEGPQLEQTDEVRTFVAKARVELVGFLLESTWTLTWILDVEPGCQHQNFRQTAVLGACQDH